MSLVQRVTSIEGTDRELPEDCYLFPDQQQPIGYSTFNGVAGYHHPQLQSPRLLGNKTSLRSLRRVISYDALPPSQSANHEAVPTVTASKISPAKRVAQVCFTVLTCWLASGIVFGFAALKPVLIDQQVYRDYCTAEELEAKVEVCYEQDLRMNLFFAVASTTCNVSALPVGTILDRYGPRVCAIIGSFFLAIGSLLMGYAFAIPEFDGYIIANVFLALGGTFLFVPSFSISNAFPKLAGTIVATVTGAFDASAAVFLFYRLAYEASRGRFTPDQFFFGYLIVPVIIFIAQFTLMTPSGYKSVPQLETKIEKAEDPTLDVHDSDDDLPDDEVRLLRAERRRERQSKLAELEQLVGDAEFREAREQKEEERQAVSGVWGALHGKPAHEQMLSPWFILMTLLTVLQMLRMNYFIATIRTQYEYMLHSEQAARKINSFFDIALPVGGVAATPMIGLILDNSSTAGMLTILVSLITAVGILGSLPFTWAAYGNVVLFCLFRPLYYSAMSDYATKVFGFATFGKIYGTIICLSGLVNLFQPAINALTYEKYDGNPIPVNVVLAVLGLVVGVVLVGYVWMEGRWVQRKQAQEEANLGVGGLDAISELEDEI